MLEQTIPVIGVPAQAPKASLATPRLVEPSRIVSEEVKNAEKNMKPAIKVKQPAEQAEPKQPVPNPIQPKKALKFPPEFITETGRPARENGEYVKEGLKKLSTGEKAVMEAFVKSRLNSLKNQGLTEKQMKKNRFKLQLVWLLNKKMMLEKQDEIVEAKKKATEAKIKAKRDLKTEKRLKAAQELQKPEVQDAEKAKNVLKQPKVSKPKSLMDIVVSQPTHEDTYDSVSSSYPTKSESTTGYQYLDDNWINSETFGSSYAPTLSSSDFTSSYSSSSTMDPTSSYSSYPISSSTLSTSSYQMPSANSYSTMNYPPDQIYSSQLSSTSNFNTMPSSFNAPPPSFPPAAPAMSNWNDLESLTVNAAAVPTDFVSSYRQEFPLQNQPLPDINSSSSPAMNPYGLSQHETQAASYDPIPTTGSILEATEEELAKQRRLLEIEEELKVINFKKMQMQMEAELREREMQLAYRQQMMEYREREIRDREMMQSRDFSSRDHYDDYDSRSSRHDDRSRSRRQESSRSSDYRLQQKHQQRNSTSSSNSRQINIERADDRRGRGRNNEGKRGGEGSLKRPAERSGHREDNSNRSGRIQPAVAPKKPRSRRPKAVHEDIQMQEISDED